MSEMGRCRDCRWWVPGQDTTSIRESRGTCLVLSSDGMGGNRAGREAPKPLADIGDVWGAPTFEPVADFGCVQFQAKE